MCPSTIWSGRHRAKTLALAALPLLTATRRYIFFSCFSEVVLDLVFLLFSSDHLIFPLFLVYQLDDLKRWNLFFSIHLTKLRAFIHRLPFRFPIISTFFFRKQWVLMRSCMIFLIQSILLVVFFMHSLMILTNAILSKVLSRFFVLFVFPGLDGRILFFDDALHFFPT